MTLTQKALLILFALFMGGCGAATQPAATTAIPLPSAAPPTARFMGDPCAKEPLAAYLQDFSVSMTQYEVSLAEVFALTMNQVSPDSVLAAMDKTQAARDSLAAVPAPYCAQKMQTALLSSMDHTVTGLNLKVNGQDAAKVRKEFSQAQVDYGTAKTEFTALSAQAGLGVTPSPTP